MVLLAEVLHQNADSVERKIPSIPHSSRSTGTKTIPLSDASPLQTRFSAQRYQRPLASGPKDRYNKCKHVYCSRFLLLWNSTFNEKILTLDFMVKK